MEGMRRTSQKGINLPRISVSGRCQRDLTVLARRARLARPPLPAPAAMIKPDELESDDGQLIWDVISASADGDLTALRPLLDQNPGLSRAQYWYTPAIHFAVRERHLEAVQFLLERGADPEWNGLHDGS